MHSKEQEHDVLLPLSQASTWVPSPEWTWQWQQLGGLQACLLTCALLARVVAGLLWGVVRCVGGQLVNQQQCSAFQQHFLTVVRPEDLHDSCAGVQSKHDEQIHSPTERLGMSCQPQLEGLEGRRELVPSSQMARCFLSRIGVQEYVSPYPAHCFHSKMRNSTVSK